MIASARGAWRAIARRSGRRGAISERSDARVTYGSMSTTCPSASIANPAVPSQTTRTPGGPGARSASGANRTSEGRMDFAYQLFSREVATDLASDPFRDLSESLLGQVLPGTEGRQYPLRERIGEGGQGWVFRATWNGSVDVVVKVLRPDAATGEALTRFQ